MKKTTHFKLEELVCPHVMKRDGQKGWRYVQPVLIDFLDWLRTSLGVPVYVNTHVFSWGDMDQRGLRCNLCELVKSKTLNGTLYLSGHIFGLAADINAEGKTSNELRDWLLNNMDKFFDKFTQYRPQYRLESSHYAPTWTHIDFYPTNNGDAVDIIKPIQ